MPQTALRVVCTILQVLAILITILRLGYRVRTRMFWVEDMWAVAALVCVVTSLIAGLKSFDTDGGQSAIICFWVYGFAFPSAIWAVRQSILFSVARIFWSTKSLRFTAIAIALGFLVLYGALVTQKAWQYGHNLDWYHHPDKDGRVHAYLSRPEIIFELITDCVSDAIIVALALHLLWGIKFPANERIIILAALSTSIIVTIVSVFRAICQFMRFRSILRIATDLELAVSLTTCNLLVATTYIYRIVIRRRRNVSEPKSDSNMQTQEVTAAALRSPATLDGRGQLTTVDLTGTGWDSQTVTQAEP
ncbi:hypothetical protein EDB19DRAFT_1020375 [Suillus lakei]|nr:hypothetical protein EDB19DRAFT_1020375 [Suillus lakei]